MPTVFEELEQLHATETTHVDRAQRAALARAKQLFEGFGKYLEAPDGTYDYRAFDEGPRLIDDGGWMHGCGFRLRVNKSCIEAFIVLQLMREPWRIKLKFSRTDEDPDPVAIANADAFNRHLVEAIRKELGAESARYVAHPGSVDRLTAPGNLTPASLAPIGFLFTRDTEASEP